MGTVNASRTRHMMRLSAACLLLFATSSALPTVEFTNLDLCNPTQTGMDGSAAAITCYGGVFLTKMLAELNQSPPLGAARKTQQHVRWHLLPYLGGAEALSTLKTDSPRDSNCTACVTDEATFEGLSALRAS